MARREWSRYLPALTVFDISRAGIVMAAAPCGMVLEVLEISVHNNRQHCNRVLMGTCSIYPEERLSPMYTLIEYPVGVIVEAVVLSMEPNRLRVAVAGFSDAVEFTQSGLEWVTERGQKIDLGFLQFKVFEAAAVFPSGRALAACAAVPYQTEG